ncbi:hypothetical protein G6F68_019749 [Rhizopus microsporus]|nr:hypothetical protein G6F68_019749 [Rhizopus microsporus]
MGLSVGVDVENENDGTLDASKANIYDCLASKYNAIKLAADTAITILRVDQIIMSKPAGGPKPPKKEGHWDADD